jgi:hypothetical protein
MTAPRRVKASPLYHMCQESAEPEARHAKAEEGENVHHRQNPLALLVAHEWNEPVIAFAARL